MTTPEITASDKVEAAASAEVSAPTKTAAVPTRFLPMPMPSAPFWLALIAAITLLAVFILSWSVVFAYAIAAAMAFFLIPVVNWMGSKGIGRTVSAIIVVLTVVVVFVVALLAIMAILINQGVPFVQSIPAALNDLETNLQTSTLPPWMSSTILTVVDTVQTAFDTVDVPSLVLGFFQGILGLVGTLISLAVIPFFLFYLMRDEPKIAENFLKNVPLQWHAHVNKAVGVFKYDFAEYFKAELIVGSIMGVVIAVGIFILGSLIPGAEALKSFALLLGLIAAVMELLPTIGPIIAMIPALIIAATISPVAFVVVLIFYLVAFQLEGSILVPTIEGKVVSFGPATVLLLIGIGFGIGGILGAILVLPVAAIVRDLFVYFFHNAEAESLPQTPAPAEASSG